MLSLLPTHYEAATSPYFVLSLNILPIFAIFLSVLLHSLLSLLNPCPIESHLGPVDDPSGLVVVSVVDVDGDDV